MFSFFNKPQNMVKLEDELDKSREDCGYNMIAQLETDLQSSGGGFVVLLVALVRNVSFIVVKIGYNGVNELFWTKSVPTLKTKLRDTVINVLIHYDNSAYIVLQFIFFFHFVLHLYDSH